jgi:hypothetical protein
VEAHDVTETMWHRGWMRTTGVLLMLISGLAGAAAVAGEAPLGVVYDEREPGVLAAEGRDVADGELLRAVSRGSLVRLDQGQMLRLAANSAVLLGRAGDGDVGVTVLAGRVATVDERGRPLIGGARSTFTLATRPVDPERAEMLLLGLDLEASPRKVDADRDPG